jgi:hypothetical protein
MHLIKWLEGVSLRIYLLALKDQTQQLDICFPRRVKHYQQHLVVSTEFTGSSENFDFAVGIGRPARRSSIEAHISQLRCLLQTTEANSTHQVCQKRETLADFP